MELAFSLTDRDHTGYFGWQVGNIKPLDFAYTRLARYQVRPGGLGVTAKRRYQPDTSYYNSSHN
ncbi:hypothetical protein D3C83_173220 [compost metagenome]